MPCTMARAACAGVMRAGKNLSDELQGVRVLVNLENHRKNFGVCSECDEKRLEGFELRSLST